MTEMEELPDAVLQYILSYMNNARDIAICNCVSKRWKESTPCIRSLFFARNAFDRHAGTENSDIAIERMVSSIDRLEELVVYTRFSYAGLNSWLSSTAISLKRLELRLDNLLELPPDFVGPSKLDCLSVAKNLESLNLWGVQMLSPPAWDVFPKLKTLQIVGARLEDSALASALKCCPNLMHFSLLACEGARGLSIDLPYLEECKLDFYAPGDCMLSINSPRIRSLDVQGCIGIWVRESNYLQNLSIANNTGRLGIAYFGNLGAVETLAIRGIQWSWDAISNMLSLASNVKHLFMKVEFTGEHSLEPFPEVDLVDFFKGHSKLVKFEIHGAMFAAICQKNSLGNVDMDFTIPSLEEVVITVRSPLNAEQKMGTLEALMKYGKNLKTMAIKILQMKSSHNSADDFFDEICRFRSFHRKKVRIE